VRTLRIYRFNPDAGGNPRLDTFELEADSPMVLDALIQIKAHRFLAHLPRSCPEGNLRSCSMNINGVNRLAAPRPARPAAENPHLPRCRICRW